MSLRQLRPPQCQSRPTPHPARPHPERPSSIVFETAASRPPQDEDGRRGAHADLPLKGGGKKAIGP